MARDEDGRADPDQLLKAIQMDATGEAAGSGSEGDKPARGHLKIFFGYAAGVGKTYAMLTAAHAAQRRGVDVVAGYIEPHRRPDTQALIAGLEILPLRKVRHHDITLEEFDIDAALRRAPQLILVDELAHTNAPGSRHEKRYQDVEELLRRGIDVYTTVNVQHIESLNDIVASITGVIVRERIPDTVFDRADQVELVDIEPADLLERLKAGNVYEGDRAERAMGNFFTVENLTALREIALRRCADRTGRLAAAARLLNNRDYHTSEHTLVCLSSSPSNPRIVRSAARMANAFHGQFTALFVETPAAQSMSDEDRARLQANMRLAEELGATVETVQGDDVALQIAEFARLSGVSEVVLGRAGSVGSGVAQLLTGKKTLVDQLITIAPNLDVHIIPDHKPIDAVSRKIGEGAREAARQELGSSTGPSVRDLVVTCLLLALSTGVGLFFQRLGFSSSSIISLYILVTLLTAVSTAGRLYTLLSSALSVALYNFFFVMPTMTFMTFDSSYLVTFAIMFVTAMVASELTTRISDSARQSAKAAYRTRVLLETNRLLQEADDADDTAKTGMRQLVKLLGRDIVYYPAVKGRLGEPVLERAASTHGHPDVLTENERAVAAWVLANNKRAGASTTTLPEAQCLYLAVRRDEQVFGVVGISLGRDRLDGTEQSISLSIVGECALAISRDIEAHERQEAAVLAKNEQLRGNLLRSIGHDLRTPLMAISGSAGILREENGRLAPTKRRQLLDNIYSNSLWLIDMVQNLLTVTHIEDGTVHLNLTSELVDDVLRESVSHLTSDAEQHEIEVVPSQGFLMAKMDVNLVVQVISNLVTNAVKYTPVGSHIRVSARPEGDMVRIVVADDGPGVADVDKPHIFDRFYTRADGKSGDSHRSFGLGLALCRSIVELHKGTIEVHDNKPHGAVFSFTLPAEEVDIHHDEQ